MTLLATACRRYVTSLGAACLLSGVLASAALAETGIASFYGNNDGFHGGPTASGERYNKFSMTAAHKTLPLNTMVRVTNLSNSRSVVVRINNRGPYVRGRVIDLSVAAAQQLGFVGNGITRVQLDVVRMGDNLRINQRRAASADPSLAGSPYAGRDASWDGGNTMSTTASAGSAATVANLRSQALDGMPFPRPRPAEAGPSPAAPSLVATAGGATRSTDPLDLMLLRERN
jgi:rare lipoprotein A